MKKQVVLIEGGSAFNKYQEYIEFLKNLKVSLAWLHNKTWRNTLQEKLGKNFDVLRLQMPNRMNAKYEEWKIYFELHIPLLDDNVILVGSSLGALFLVKYLSENKFSKKIEKLVLVAAPRDPLGDFIIEKDLEGSTLQADDIVIIQSSDDPLVPLKDAQKYHEDIKNSKLFILKDRGHFNEDNFPEIIEILNNENF